MGGMDKEDFQDIRKLVDEIEELSKAADDTAEAIRRLDENGGKAELYVYARGEYRIAMSPGMGKKMLGAALESYQELIAQAKNRIDIKIERLAGKDGESGEIKCDT